MAVVCNTRKEKVGFKEERKKRKKLELLVLSKINKDEDVSTLSLGEGNARWKEE